MIGQPDESTTESGLPAPRWARATGFVGLYVLVLAGAVALQEALESLLALLGLDNASLEGAGIVAGLYLGATGLRRLLYDAGGASHGHGLYRTAWSIAAVLAAGAATVALLVTVRLAAPDLAAGWTGAALPPTAMVLALAAAEPFVWFATRRRERLAAMSQSREEDSARTCL